jgi:hypothetical protein
LAALRKQLRDRNPKLTGNLNELLQLTRDVVKLQESKKSVDIDSIIAQAVEGDSSNLKMQLNMPVEMQEASVAKLQKMI